MKWAIGGIWWGEGKKPIDLEVIEKNGRKLWGPITGAAGFIGSALVLRLLGAAIPVVVSITTTIITIRQLKKRVARHTDHRNYTHLRIDLSDRQAIEDAFKSYQPDRVVNLAAQAGVRYSIENPLAYIDSNIVGFAHILEGCRQNNVEHLVYASSSSVYGANTSMPFSVHDNVDHPLSLYAASKKSNELIAHTYSHLYGLPTTGLRFLQSMALGVVLTWRCSNSPKRFWPVTPLMF